MIATNSSASKKVKKLQKQFKELKEDFIELEENLEEAMDKNMQEFGEDMIETMDENMQELDKNMTETMDENMHHVNHSLNHLDKRIDNVNDTLMNFIDGTPPTTSIPIISTQHPGTGCDWGITTQPLTTQSAGMAGNTWDCCKSWSPCRENEGDCDSDEDCFGDLLCGSNNCQSNFPHDADCCYDAGKDHFNISTNIEPNQCDVIEYHILNDETRNLNYGNYEAYCDGDNDLCKSPDWKGSSWYRFDGPGGTRIPEKIAERYHCNTYAPGWLNGTHPTISEETVERRVCFNFNGDFCKIQTDIQIKNCGSYFLYYLKDVTIDWPYNYRYCSE